MTKPDKTSGLMTCDIETEMLENMITLISRGRDVGGMEWQLSSGSSLLDCFES